MPRLNTGVQGSPIVDEVAAKDRLSDGTQGSPVFVGTATAGTRRTSGAQGSPVVRETIAEPPTITTTSLPDGTESTAYSQTLEAAGGTAPYTWSISVGALPDGLSLNAATGAITGTPAAATTYNFTVLCTDAVEQADTQELSIVVAAISLTDVAPHNMTSNTAPTPYVVSAQRSYDPYSPFRAFDGAKGAVQYWLGNGGVPVWLQIDMGSGNTYRLHSYAIAVNALSEPARAPKDWTLLGSNDGSNWDTIDTVTGQAAWASGEEREFACDVNATAYRYFRINVTANNTNEYTQIAELKLYAIS